MTLLPPRPALELQNYTTGADAVKGVRSSEAAVLLQRAATDRGPLVVASDFNQVKRSFEASLKVQARRKDYDEAEWAIVAKGVTDRVR